MDRTLSGVVGLTARHYEDLLRDAADAKELRAKLTASEERVRVLSEALRKLEAEVSGLAAFEIEVREAIGNTNWSVLVLRRNEARQALKRDTHHIHVQAEDIADSACLWCGLDLRNPIHRVRQALKRDKP